MSSVSVRILALAGGTVDLERRRVERDGSVLRAEEAAAWLGLAADAEPVAKVAELRVKLQSASG